MKASFSTKSQKNGVVFKPLIATSLALALGISVGNASNGQAPNISFGSSTTPTPSITWLGNDGYYKMSHNNGSALDNFSFYLETNGSKYSTTTIETTSTSYTAHISTSIDSLTLSTTANGIKMGDNGKGTLTIGGGNKSNGHSKDMTLNLHNISNDNHYALMGNLSIDNWQTGSTTAKIGGKGILGNLTLKAVAGTNTFTFNKNAGIEGNLILKGGNHNITFGNNTDPSTPQTSYTPKITGDIQATGGNTTIKGLTTIEGNISLDSGNGGTNHTQTYIIFNGTSANIGTQSKNSDLTLKLRLTSSGATWNHSGSNTIISNSSTNTFKLGEVKVDGNYGSTNPQNRTFNIISLNQDGSTKNSISNNISINTTHSSYGNNIIGKNLVTTSNTDNPTITYNSTLFGSNTPTIQNGFITEFVKTEHSVKGTFNFGDNSGDIKNAFISNACGGNYININGTTTIKDNILSENKHSSAGSTNILILTGTSATLGESSKKISITINNASNDGYGHRSYSNNTLLLGADTNTLDISDLSVRGDYGSTNPQSRTFNILSFNNDNQNNRSNTGNIDSISASGGYNIIGKDLITQGSGYNSTLFGSNTPTIQNNFSTNFAKDSHNAKGTYTIRTISANDGTNYINVENLTMTSNISSRGGENLIVAKTLTFNSTSNITAGNGGYGARNVFDVSGSIGFGNNLVIKADNTTNQKTHKHNIFKIGGNITTNQTIQELTAITGNSNHNYTINILSFEGNTNSSNSLTINSINKTSTINDKATGHNYIGKALTQGEGLGINLVSNFANSWSSEKHQANLTLKANNGVYAKYGKNYINVASLSVDGDIDGNAGHNYISTSTFTSNGAIKARWRGSNTIIVDGASTINGNIEVGSTERNDFGINNLTFGGNTTISGSILINTNNASNKNNITLSKVSSSLTLKGATNQISTLTALPTIDDNPSQNNTLTLDTTNNSITANIDTLENGDNLKIDFKGGSDKSIALTLNSFGSTDAKLRSVSVSDGTNNTLAFNQSATIIDPINSASVGSNKRLTLQVNSNATLHAQGGIDKSNGGAINMVLNGGTLTFGKNTNHISNLSGNGVINLSHTPNTLQASQIATNDKRLRNSLTIDSFTSGETTFKLYASSTQNDRVIFNGGSNGAKAIITLVGEKDIHDITYNGHLNADNTLVAQTNNASGMIVEGGESLIGIDRIRIELISTTDNQTTNYYVGKVVDLGVDPVFQDMSNTALMINYDLFLANFNSLNKRMGELRDNANNHGIWGRVFGGSTSNSFGAGSTTNYITTQVGYDYSIDVGENARNYTGIALAYGSSTTKSKALNITASTSLINTISLDNIKSNVIELGLYNAYVADNGWYNDTIFKFNYLMSEFSMSNNSNLTSKINNFALILSDEFGYRYKFAENEKGNWFIDPQLEVAVGYFNQSDFVRTVFDYSSDLYAYQDAIFTLRTRIGASLGKKFNTEKGFATLYAGAFYEHDYIKGGASESKGGGSQMIAQLENIHSNDRAIVNVGSNIELTEGARLYIDVEKSFGEKHRTHMQFNLGARYSF